jgi:hypothetical protein
MIRASLARAGLDLRGDVFETTTAFLGRSDEAEIAPD